MKKLIEIIKKYREQVLYLVFGGLTTVINIVSYYIFCNLIHFGIFQSNLIAWILSVVFAYTTNRIWVFESKNYGYRAVFRELVLFFGARVFSLGIDMGIMYTGVELLKVNDMLTKVVSNVVVVVMNYIFSKLVIFSKD